MLRRKVTTSMMGTRSMTTYVRGGGGLLHVSRLSIIPKIFLAISAFLLVVIVFTYI